MSETELVDAKKLFGIDKNIKVYRFVERNSYVPAIDTAYQFNTDVTLAILVGLMYNRRVLIQGLHGTGKSTHIEQVAARLNWPCIRVNLDANMSRFDLIGKDVLKIENNKQVTSFQEGVIPWAMQNNMMLIFDEYDAGRPDVMFIIQRLLEQDGKLLIPDKNNVIEPHEYFRLFATANTVGLGDFYNMYRGSQVLNQAQLDRWNILVTLNYLTLEDEMKIVAARVPSISKNDKNLATLRNMVQLANMVRNGHKVGDLTNIMSPRTVISWAENFEIFQDLQLSFELSFLNKCVPDEKEVIAEYYQRCFGIELIIKQII